MEVIVMSDAYAKIFAVKFRSIRNEKGFTQSEMAEFLDCSQQTINVWESGQHTPKITMLVKIADSFGVSVDWLLGRKEPIKIITEIPQEDKTIVELYRKFNNEGRTEAEKMLNLLLLNPSYKEKENVISA
jgi:transcriptional regulator with XRE-family HTH domain